MGWTPAGVFEAKDLPGQFDQALANVRAVLDAAGGQPEDVIRMTIYVTDPPAYRAGVKGLGPIWRRHWPPLHPAMALVGVTGLVEPEALVEIETTAVLPEETPDPEAFFLRARGPRRAHHPRPGGSPNALTFESYQEAAAVLRLARRPGRGAVHRDHRGRPGVLRRRRRR
ncbi:MAG: RidA family protein [bacterium]